MASKYNASTHARACVCVHACVDACASCSVNEVDVASSVQLGPFGPCRPLLHLANITYLN